MGDPALRQLQQSVGNDELRQQLNQGRADRATMLAHVMDRLNVVHELQRRELSLVLGRGASYEWWRQVAKANGEEVTLPDPTRWHDAAAAYKDAASSLARGDLSRGRQQLERAMEIDDRTVRQMTDLVSTADLEFATRPDTSALDDLVAIGTVEPIDVPDEIRSTADDILKVEVEAPQTPDIRVVRRPWWAEEEEEDEEGAPDGDDPGGG